MILNGFVDKGTDSLVSMDIIKKSYMGEDSEFNPQALFCNALCASVCFSNDMKHIHLHAVGEDFDKIHDLAQSLYEKASDESDLLAELALEYNVNVPNFSLCAKCVNWAPLSHSEYDYPSAVSMISSRLLVYIAFLKALRESSVATDDMQSKLDDMIRDWHVELDYKLKMRSKCTESDSCCNFG